MKILAGPLVVEGSPANPGYTGFVIVDKSHIAIHTFDTGNKASIDIFSCERFDNEAVLRYLNKHFKFGKIKTQILERSEE
jgi:S-adenosylmethionine/arginine decarboxylase-like enzyme